MPTAIIPPNNHLLIRRSLPRRRPLEFYVEAGDPVTTYLVDREGHDAFYRGDDVPYYGGFANRRTHNQKVYLDAPGIYYLIIVNNGSKDVAAHWEIY